MKENRLVFISDVHYMVEGVPHDNKGLNYYYGEENDFRVQKIVDLISEEHRIAPIDAVIFLGDTTHEQEVNLRDFCKTWQPKLPCPAYFLPGNHESHSEEVWTEITGSGRQSVVEIPYGIVLLCDCFYDLQHPHKLQPMDMSFLVKQAEQHKGKKLLLCTHYFQCEETLKEWLTSTPEVVAVFHGHSHLSLPLTEEFGGKKVVSTGNFSYGLNMKPEPEWYQKYGWSITEVTECSGQWKCRKIYPDMKYEFSKLQENNRFYQEMYCDYTIKKEYGEWLLLSQ